MVSIDDILTYMKINVGRNAVSLAFFCTALSTADASVDNFSCGWYQAGAMAGVLSLASAGTTALIQYSAYNHFRSYTAPGLSLEMPKES